LAILLRGGSALFRSDLSLDHISLLHQNFEYGGIHVVAKLDAILHSLDGRVRRVDAPIARPADARRGMQR